MIISKPLSSRRQGIGADMAKRVLICILPIIMAGCSTFDQKDAKYGCRRGSHAIDMADETRSSLSFAQAPYVHPLAISKLLPPLVRTDIENVAATVLTKSDKTPFYIEPIETHADDDDNLWIYSRFNEHDCGKSISYRHLGETPSGITVLHVANWPGGSGVFHYIVLVEIKQCSTWDYDGDIPLQPRFADRVVLMSRGAVIVDDRFAGRLKLEDSRVMISERDTIYEAENGGYAMPYSEYGEWKEFMSIP